MGAPSRLPWHAPTGTFLPVCDAFYDRGNTFWPTIVFLTDGGLKTKEPPPTSLALLQSFFVTDLGRGLAHRGKLSALQTVLGGK